MLTHEKAQALADYLSADEDRAKKLLEMTPESAVAEINADGNNFSVEELVEFGEVLKTASTSDEVDAAALDQVTGGSISVGMLLGVGFATKVAYDVGKAIGKNAPW